MRNFKRLTATVEQTAETFVLFDGEEFKNFDRLHELVGNDYDGLNDDLMDGITELTGTSWKYNKYENAEAVLTIRFDFEPTKCYSVKPEFMDYWGSECTEDYVVTEEEVKYLAAEWGKSFEELLEQLEEV